MLYVSGQPWTAAFVFSSCSNPGSLRYLYVLYAITTFVILFLILFPFFLLFGWMGQWGRQVIWQLIRAWSYIWFFLIGMPVKRIYRQRPEKGKHYIVVANHISYIDTAMIFRAVPFFVRPLAKSELARIPLFGYLYRQMAVLVERGSAKSRLKSVQHLRRSLQREGSIFIFPEGAFNETGEPLKSFYDGAFRLALHTRTPILPVLFPDTVKRWHYKSFWSWSPGISRAVFLPEISVAGLERTDIPLLKEQVYQTMDTALRQLTATP